MQTGDAELEMRGRCSAGQKVHNLEEITFVYFHHVVSEGEILQLIIGFRFWLRLSFAWL